MSLSDALTTKKKLPSIPSVVYPLVVRLKENTPTAAFSKLLLLLLTAKGSLPTLSPLQLFQTFTPVRRNGAYQRAQALEQLRRRVGAFPWPQQQKQELIYTAKPWSGHTVGRSKVAQDRTVPCVFLVRGKINQNIHSSQHAVLALPKVSPVPVLAMHDHRTRIAQIFSTRQPKFCR